jgi:uncharacterized membrane protein YsdA (DUF1294 family)
MKTAAVLYLTVVALMSFGAFVAYGIDKRRAQMGSRRVPENRLHVLALAGGWPGALVARQVFRHKTQKLGFRLIFWTVVVFHLGIVGTVVHLLRQ